MFSTVQIREQYCTEKAQCGHVSTTAGNENVRQKPIAKRASLVRREAKKTSKVVVGDEADATDGFRKRVLLSLVIDVLELRETVERLQISVFTLAREDGIEIPEEI